LDADIIEFTVARRKQSKLGDARFMSGCWSGGLGAGGWPTGDHGARTVADLAAGRLDGEHLAEVVIDAVVNRRVGEAVPAQALRPHAHRYQLPPGQGALLVHRLLEQRVPDRDDGQAAWSWITELARRMQSRVAPVMTPALQQMIDHTATQNESILRRITEQMSA
jgi:hypothetical protein